MHAVCSQQHCLDAHLTVEQSIPACCNVTSKWLWWVCRQGIIFLILNYNHIKTTLRAADSSVAQRISSGSGSGGKGSQQQQQPAPGTAAGGLGSAGAAAIKECEVRQGHE